VPGPLELSSQERLRCLQLQQLFTEVRTIEHPLQRLGNIFKPRLDVFFIQEGAVV